MPELKENKRSRIITSKRNNAKKESYEKDNCCSKKKETLTKIKPLIKNLNQMSNFQIMMKIKIKKKLAPKRSISNI